MTAALNCALALASAALVVLAFPGYNISWLMAAALAPLLIVAAQESRWRLRFLYGWLTGAVVLAGVTDWIRFVITVHGSFHPLAGWAIFLLYCAAKGLYWGIFSALAGPLMKRWWAVPGVAALWVAVDFTAGAAGYIWVTLGNAGVDMSLPMRLAPLTGVHGLSFVFVMMSASAALVLLRRPRRQLLWLLALLLLAVLPPQADFAAGDRFAVVLQPHLDEQQFYSSAEQVHQLSARLAFLTMHGVLEAGSEKPALMIWSEMPAPFYYEEDPILRQQVGSLARVTRTPLLFNMVGHARDGAPLNSALALSAQGEPLARYDKIHLVPFGEYVPWPFGLIVQKFTSEIGDFRPGSSLVLWRLEGHRAASFICYESAFPSLPRDFTQAGAEVLFNLSNDGYFGRSLSARGQHLLLVRMRAAENGRWIVRATNDGFTAAVDPAGRIVDRVPAFQQSVSRMQFSFRKERTFYTRWGDWFGWSCVALSTMMLAPSARALFTRGN